MRMKFSWVVVTLIAFSVGVAVLYIRGSYQKLEDNLVRILSPQLEGDQFSLEMSACGPALNSHQYLILSTGESLEQTGELFSSPEAANKSLEIRLAHATTILERTNKAEGQKVIALYPSGASIFFTHGAILTSINAPNVEIAREFESA